MKKNFQITDTIVCVLIVCIGMALYIKTAFFGFTYTDDTHLIVVNNDVLKDFANLPRLFTQDVFISYSNTNLYFRPLLNLSFMVDAHYAGIEPGLYHLTNVILHIICSLLVFHFFRTFNYSTLFAGFFALVFTVHPLITSAVAWIPGRNDTLFALFIIPSFLGFKKYAETLSMKAIIFSALFLFLALLTKETAIVLPFLCLMYLRMMCREQFTLKTLSKPILCWLAVIGSWWLLRSNVVRESAVVQMQNNFSDSFAQNIPAFLIYLGKALFPFDLSVFPDIADYQMWWGIASLIVFGLLYLLIRTTDSSRFTFGIAWFLVFLVPGMITGNIFWEHRAYVPLIGLLFAVSVPVQLKLVGSVRLKIAVACVAIVILFMLSFKYGESFRDRKSYTTNAMTMSPSLDDSYIAMAGNLVDHFDYMKAEEVINLGLKKNKNMRSVYKMLGDIHWFFGDTAKAFDAYRKSIIVDPLNLYAYINYGKFCLDVGRVDQTEILWKRTVEINPEFLLGYYYLANFYLHEKNEPMIALHYAEEIQKHGAEIMPELLKDIRSHPQFKQNNQQ